MFDKIGGYAESVATSAGQSRRGFLGLMGKSALSLASLVGGFLLFQGEAIATVCSGSCRYLCPDGTFHTTNCGSTCGCNQSIQHAGMTCSLSFIEALVATVRSDPIRVNPGEDRILRSFDRMTS